MMISSYFLKSCQGATRGWGQEPLIWSWAMTAQVLLRNPVSFSTHSLGVDFCYRATWQWLSLIICSRLHPSCLYISHVPVDPSHVLWNVRQCINNQSVLCGCVICCCLFESSSDVKNGIMLNHNLSACRSVSKSILVLPPSPYNHFISNVELLS